MKHKRIILILVLAAAGAVRAVPEGARWSSSDSKSLRIHLPRNIKLDKRDITLGDVSIIRGSEPLAGSAGEIELGRIAFADQKLSISRGVIISRLASSGFSISDISFSGSETIEISLEHTAIKPEQFLASANLFLTENPPSQLACQWEPVGMPEELVIQGLEEELELKSAFAPINSRGYIKVRIDVIRDKDTLGFREILYRLKFKCRRVVAVSDIITGSLITPANTRVEEYLSNNREPEEWNSVYGQVAAHKLLEGAVVRPGVVMRPRAKVIVKRNQNVLIKIEHPGFLVTDRGKAMENGRAGDFIKVKNISSQRIIFAKVMTDGSVAPVF